MMVWTLTEANGTSHGPFQDLFSVVRYIQREPSNGRRLVEPLCLAQVTNGDRRPVYQVIFEAYKMVTSAILAKKVAS